MRGQTGNSGSPEPYDEFVRLLDAPIETLKLAAPFAEESPFGQVIEID